MIREHEQKRPIPSHAVQSCGRVPVFAISGMLRRGDEQRYADAGFDGWMPKPIDMKRLSTYLAGAWDITARRRGQYNEMQFELGGWFAVEEVTPTPAKEAVEPLLEVYPPLPETPAVQGYQLGEDPAPEERPDNDAGKVRGEFGATPTNLQTLDEEPVLEEAVPAVERRSSLADIASHEEPGREVAPAPAPVPVPAPAPAPGTPEWPPIASPWRLD